MRAGSSAPHTNHAGKHSQQGCLIVLKQLNVLLYMDQAHFVFEQ
jgi:hypothetical protein